MPSVSFKGKTFVQNHHLTVPFHELIADSAGSSVAQPQLDGNLVIHGENLVALKALLPTHAERVKFIYIDPPYNTGNEGWVYNDSVNSPMIQDWIGKVVGKEGEDLTRHDKWLCMMMPRLRLLRELLTTDGVILVSIGETSYANLRLLLDEIFGYENRLATFIWNTEGNTENQDDITRVHEYILSYAKSLAEVELNKIVDHNVSETSKLHRDFSENSIVKNTPKNPASMITLPVGFPAHSSDYRTPAHPGAKAIVKRIESQPVKHVPKEDQKAMKIGRWPIQLDEMEVRDNELVRPCRVYSGWQNADKLRQFIHNDCVPMLESDGTRLSFFLDHNASLLYRREGREAQFIPTVIRNVGTTEVASNQLRKRFGIKFDYPKPVGLISYFLSIFCKPGDIVLDSFAGSGTTGEAAAIDGFEYILIEMEKLNANNIGKRLKGISSEYALFRVGNELSPRRLLAGTDLPSFKELAAYVYYTATGERLAIRNIRARSFFVGESTRYEIYMLYQPDVAWLKQAALTAEILQKLVAGRRDRRKRLLVFAPTKYVELDALRDVGAEFSQLPFEIYRRR